MKAGFKETAACSEELGIAKLLGLLCFPPSLSLLFQCPQRTGQCRRLRVVMWLGVLGTSRCYLVLQRLQEDASWWGNWLWQQPHGSAGGSAGCAPHTPAPQLPSQLPELQRCARQKTRSYPLAPQLDGFAVTLVPAAATRPSFEGQDWKPKAPRGAKATCKARLLTRVALCEDEGMALPRTSPSARISWHQHLSAALPLGLITPFHHRLIALLF